MLEFSPKSLTAMSCLNSALAHHAISSYLLFCCEIILPLCENVENLISAHHQGPKFLKVSRAVYRINTVIKMIWMEICQPGKRAFPNESMFPVRQSRCKALTYVPCIGALGSDNSTLDDRL